MPSYRPLAPLQIQGGCANSPLCHGFQIPPGQAELAADLIGAAPESIKKLLSDSLKFLPPFGITISQRLALEELHQLELELGPQSIAESVPVSEQ